MQHALEYNDSDFNLLNEFFCTAPKHIEMTANDLSLWPLYQNELELNTEHGFHLIFPFSFYQTDDFDDDEEFDHVKYEIKEPEPLRRFPYGASFIDHSVYIHLNHGKIIKVVNQQGRFFYLKKTLLKNYHIKPLDEINPAVYPRSHYFQEHNIIHFMNDMGVDLKYFMVQHTQLAPEIIFMLTEKIIQKVAELHQKQYIHADIKPENICIQYDERHPEQSIVSLIDCESCQSIEDHVDLSRITLPGTFTYYAPEIFIQLPTYVCDFKTLMLFQELSYEVINKTLSKQKELRALRKNGIDITSLVESDFLASLNPNQYFRLFMKNYEFGVLSIQTDLFALGCVLKEFIDYYDLSDFANQQIEHLIEFNPSIRSL